MNQRKLTEGTRRVYGGGTGLKMSRSQKSQEDNGEEPARSYDCSEYIAVH